MGIVVVGINHKTASIELREKFAFSRDEIANQLDAMHTARQEAVILSTCNRTEIYSYSIPAHELQKLFFKEDFLEHGYILEGIEAVKHLMQVACGLDSLVLGEPEILGQVKSAFSSACLHKTVGPQLSRLFRQTFHVAKQIRSSTKIGACPVSVASTAVMYLSEWWNTVSQNQMAFLGNGHPCPRAPYHPWSARPSVTPSDSVHLLSSRILVIGAGNVGRLAAQHVQSLTSHPVFIMSRHFVNARQLASEMRGIAVDFSQLADVLHQVDVVISATSSKTTIISAAHVSAINKPLLMMDLAVPRDIAPEVIENTHVTLCQLDQLKEIIQAHAHARSHAAKQAEKLIEAAACDFMLSLRTFDSDDIIKQYRANMELYCEQALEKFSSDALTRDDLKSFSQHLLNKIMHLPSVQLRQASQEGRHDVLLSAFEIFGLQGNKS